MAGNFLSKKAFKICAFEFVKKVFKIEIFKNGVYELLIEIKIITNL